MIYVQIWEEPEEAGDLLMGELSQLILSHGSLTQLERGRSFFSAKKEGVYEPETGNRWVSQEQGRGG